LIAIPSTLSGRPARVSAHQPHAPPLTTASVQSVHRKACRPRVSRCGWLLASLTLLVATTIGMGPAILASVLAFLGFNFFFVEPLHSFRVTDPQDDLRLLTFLVVAITGSSLAGRAREQANAAARSARELAALYDFSQKISAEVDLERILPLVAQTVTQLLNVPACNVLLYDSAGRLIERASAGTARPEPQRRVDAFLRIGPRVLGVLRVTQRALNDPLTPEEQSRLETIVADLRKICARGWAGTPCQRRRPGPCYLQRDCEGARWRDLGRKCARWRRALQLYAAIDERDYPGARGNAARAPAG
jgi:hypothetical protein